MQYVAVPKIIWRALKRTKKIEIRLLLEMTGLLMLLPLLKRTLSLPALIRFFDAEAKSGKQAVDLDRLIQLAKGLLNLRIGFLSPNCVKQSLILFHFLRKQGHPANIHFGISKNDAGDLHGHAWVSLAGKPFAEPEDPRSNFKETYVFPENFAKNISSEEILTS